MWTSATDGRGYGTFMLRTGQSPARAHRLAWELTHGPIPDGYEIDHLCRTPLCVRPAHLEPVPPRVNNLRSASQAAVHAAQVDCVNGHPFDEVNTYLYRGRRMCKACARERRRAEMADPEKRAAINARRRARYAEKKEAAT